LPFIFVQTTSENPKRKRRKRREWCVVGGGNDNGKELGEGGRASLFYSQRTYGMQNEKLKLRGGNTDTLSKKTSNTDEIGQQKTFEPTGGDGKQGERGKGAENLARQGVISYGTG